MSLRVRLASVADLPQGRGTCVVAAGHRIALFRIGENVHAIGDRCTHAEASLAEGEVWGTAVECPRHGSEFDLVTGIPASLPATLPVAVYPLEIVDGQVYATLEPREEEAE
jgi:3-phenylpropionate/trans-cinnamate dioxygenase ferredoxin component